MRASSASADWAGDGRGRGHRLWHTSGLDGSPARAGDDHAVAAAGMAAGYALPAAVPGVAVSGQEER